VTGWPSYTPRYWVPFSSPPTTRRATPPPHGPHREHLFHWLVLSRCRGNNVSAELFPGNGCCTVVCLHSCYLAVGVPYDTAGAKTVSCIQLNDEWCRAKRKRKRWGRRLSEGLNGSCN
jgi:hypothetical protein